MTDVLAKFDAWLADDGPAALVIREHLVPVEGNDGVIFPATFAAGDNFPGGYNVDAFPDGKNVCLIDTVGSQANRLEPIFEMDKYAGLVPQVVVKAGPKKVSLLEAGHRSADAVVRCSALQKELQDAFRAVLSGNAEPLARIAPTSLVFGVWDSRDTQAKLPRLIASTIRAFDVRKLTRSAQYVPAVEYVATGVIDEPENQKAKDALAQHGFAHVPSSATHGGVIAVGGIRRDATLALAALRILSAGTVSDRTLALRRYILGLALTAFTHDPPGYLRQGCNLVLDPDNPRVFETVHGDGRRTPAKVTHDEAVAYANATAKAFGIDPKRKIEYGNGTDREVDFDNDVAKRVLKGEVGDGAASPKRPKRK
jgi:CRISPR-associated protein Csb1